MSLLPTGNPSFKKMIENDYIYVDKTKYIYDLITNETSCFLSRPRRFGKSLLIGTMYELFSGNKDLFKGLDIENLYDDWDISYPIILLDFMNISLKNSSNLKKSLNLFLDKIADNFNIILEDTDLIEVKFADLLEKIHIKTGNEVVILIDEYDRPVLDTMHDKNLSKMNLELIADFYGVIKSNNQHIRFVFMTGVSKFSKTSIFSGLNSITDISLDNKYSTICGYTNDELLNSFDDYIIDVSEFNDMSKEEFLNEIRLNYDGYSWDGINFVYNPYSILHCFKRQTIDNYWFETGTPTFLIDLIKKEKKTDLIINTTSTNSSPYSNFSLKKLNLKNVLVQTGYLTIKKIIRKKGKIENYVLDIPNKEVEESLFDNLVSEYTEYPIDELDDIIADIYNNFKNKDNEGLNINLTTLFSNITYHQHKDLKNEAYWHSMFSFLFKLLGFNVISERVTNIGRVDAVIDEKEFTCICEVKYGDDKTNDELIEEAINQIYEKKYYEPYLRKNNIFLVGIGFSNRTVKAKFFDLDYDKLELNN
ncbi:MAG: ATP-binding protein [Methanobrevibacter sp.]|jgi:hypothetical protein|nr:ATP-binding protein [Candidatus Methanoflexus mossambicus]